MASYEYRCSACGPFVVQRAIGTAISDEACPSCGGDARRVFSAPHLALASAPVRRGYALEEKSRDHPDVVTSVPPAARPRSRAPYNPAWSKLPRT